MMPMPMDLNLHWHFLCPLDFKVHNILAQLFKSSKLLNGLGRDLSEDGVLVIHERAWG